MASFSVVSNISSANAQANLTTTNLGLNKALTRLSSGSEGPPFGAVPVGPDKTVARGDGAVIGP